MALLPEDAALDVRMVLLLELELVYSGRETISAQCTTAPVWEIRRTESCKAVNGRLAWGR